jgi:hypothetical protein
MGRCVGLVIVVAAGCFAPHPPANLPCTPAGDCPEGLSCEQGVCVSAPLPDAPGAMADAAADAPADVDGDITSTDGDGDGVQDLADNCPSVSNPTQHDEDDDARGDACDGCPHVAQTSFVDGDGDEVDDPCDPNPSAAGDFIARFDAFDTVPTDYVITGGNWAAATDRYRQLASGTGMTTLLVPGTRDQVTMEVGGTIDVVGGTSRELKVIGGRIAASDWHSCCFDDTDGTAVFVLEIEDENGGGASTIILASPPRPDRLDVGAFVLRIAADAGADSVACHSLEGGDVVEASTAMATTLPPGQVGLISSSVAFSLDYLIVFGRN